MLENARASLNDEPGCHQFDVCFAADDPGRCFLYEVYTDRGAFDAHLGMAHFKAFDAKVKTDEATGFLGELGFGTELYPIADHDIQESRPQQARPLQSLQTRSRLRSL